jgi:hypothetical protein
LARHDHTGGPDRSTRAFLGAAHTPPTRPVRVASIVIASAGLLLAVSMPLGRDALIDPATFAIAIVGLIILLTTELDTL